MTKPSKERVKEVQDYLNEISMELSKKYSVCQILCGLIGHKWFTNEGCTFCLRCMESNATTLSQQRKKLLEAKTEARKQERKAKNVK